MEIKYVIFLVAATAAQSSVTPNSLNSCAPVTDIAADLEVIQFAHDVTHSGLIRQAEIVFNLIRTLLAERAGEIHVDLKYDESRFALARNEALTAGTTPIIPLVEAVRTFQPRIDMESNIRQATAIITSLVNNYFHGIELSQERNYSEALAEIEETEKRAFADCDSFLQGVFDALLNGTVQVPHEAQSVIACAHAEAASALRDGAAGIFDGAKLLLQANSFRTEAGKNINPSQIEHAFNRTIEGYTGEIVNKIAAIRNLTIAAFLKKIGIVRGLFAIQSTPFRNYV